MKRAARVYNYTKSLRGWGWDYTLTPKDNGQSADAMGWGRGIEPGDYMLINVSKDSPKITRYRFDRIEYYHDPPDMWNARLSYAGRRLAEQIQDDPHLKSNESSWEASSDESEI